ncbi:MAG: MFS transporter [Anaerolineae bacterium CG_4_9_14_3_um_filter_57_17]|nr:ATP-binding cassette domain-containing protein [bacterium]NCT20987.1 ATP-binding cassette domain-containing protein [bacterium]OIO85113.1 MAG: MFS transporter [Anaerolineae bacterium CG2_30_57_67]PJB66154.1 MAG: MFS transporter [Anaerolineae bacterium CG_4_9_14_3_um_filter_57_17]
MIQVSGLTKFYGARRAIDQLNFETHPGEIVGFLGPNGAGKTTTMRILTGYMPASSGVATVAGYDVMKESLEVRKRVGYLPETVPLYTDMTVFGYLKFMADLRHMPNITNAVEEALEKVGLLERAGGYISNLSKGMRQRVGLAQALLHKPEVLILDEPTIGLDPAQIIEVRNIIREVGKERTVLLSTHILTEAQQICDRVLIINKGKIVVEDTTNNLQSNLAGGQQAQLIIRGEAAQLAPSLQKVPGVREVKLTAADSLQFSYESKQDPRPQVARAVLAANFDLLEMRLISLSLEDIFLELTREDAPKEAE